MKAVSAHVVSCCVFDKPKKLCRTCIATFHTYFFKWANPGLFFVHFLPFLITISIIQIEKAQMVCLGFEPGAAGWQAQMKPRSLISYMIDCLADPVVHLLLLKSSMDHQSGKPFSNGHQKSPLTIMKNAISYESEKRG